MAKKKKKKVAKPKSNAMGTAFNIRFNDVRDVINTVLGDIKKAKAFGGTRLHNSLEAAHADRMVAALEKAKAFAVQECCHNDQSCTLFMMKSSR